jgi:hypothetical protein
VARADCELEFVGNCERGFAFLQSQKGHFDSGTDLLVGVTVGVVDDVENEFSVSQKEFYLRQC